MAKAYECDRCGVLFGETDRDDTSDPDKLYVVRQDDLYRIRPLDLCYVCQSKFDEWWNAGRAGTEENNE